MTGDAGTSGRVTLGRGTVSKAEEQAAGFCPVASRVERQQGVQVSRLRRRRMISFGEKPSDSCAVLPDGSCCGASSKYTLFTSHIERVKYLL